MELLGIVYYLHNNNKQFINVSMYVSYEENLYTLFDPCLSKLVAINEIKLAYVLKNKTHPLSVYDCRCLLINKDCVMR